jgi:mono/diheme cytochrome c family protein
MKYLLFLCFFFLATSCMLTKEPAYEIPPGLAEADKKEFIERFKKGSVLYNMNCAKCHNKTIKGKVVEPQFTIGQLENYELRVKNPEHVENLSPKKVSPEDLREVIYYLRNKKKPKS